MKRCPLRSAITSAAVAWGAIASSACGATNGAATQSEQTSSPAPSNGATGTLSGTTMTASDSMVSSSEAADSTASASSPGASTGDGPSTSASDTTAPPGDSTAPSSETPSGSTPPVVDNSAPSGTTAPPAAPPPPTPSVSNTFKPEGSSIRPGSGPLGVETTCDGIDDDENGVIDDVDTGADGVCDCLRVATLGLHGEWGGGNVVTGWLRSRTDTMTASLDGEPLTEARLAPYQVLLIRDVSSNNTPGLSFTSTEAEALWNWVRAGGGLMTVIGYSDSNEINNVNRLLEPFALSYGTEQVVQGGGTSTAITEWFEHPLTVGITAVGGDNGYPAVGQGVTIAAQDGYDIGKAITIGDGHVLVWGDEWITYEDEWKNDSTYQVAQFWQNALRWLTRVNECQVPPL